MTYQTTINAYTQVTNYDQDGNYRADIETVVTRGVKTTRTVYRPIDAPKGVAIPPRPTKK